MTNCKLVIHRRGSHNEKSAAATRSERCILVVGGAVASTGRTSSVIVHAIAADDDDNEFRATTTDRPATTTSSSQTGVAAAVSLTRHAIIPLSAIRQDPSPSPPAVQRDCELILRTTGIGAWTLQAAGCRSPIPGHATLITRVFTCVRLSVRPLSDYSKTTEQIFITFYGMVGRNPGTNRLDFGGNPDLYPDPGIF